MNKFKNKIQDGTINIPGILLRAALLWFILSFLVFPNVNLILEVFVKDGKFTTSAISKIMSSERALKSLKNSFVLACASIITVNITGILIVCILRPSAAAIPFLSGRFTEQNGRFVTIDYHLL